MFLQSVDLYLVSDCYIGLDQQHTVRLPHVDKKDTHTANVGNLEGQGSETEDEDLFEDAHDKALHPSL